MDYERTSSGPRKEEKNNEEQTKEKVLYSPKIYKSPSGWNSQVNYSVTPGESDSANTLATLNFEPATKRQRMYQNDVDSKPDYHFSLRPTPQTIISSEEVRAASGEAGRNQNTTTTPSRSFSGQTERGISIDSNIGITNEQLKKQTQGNMHQTPISPLKTTPNFLPNFPLSLLPSFSSYVHQSSADYIRDVTPKDTSNIRDSLGIPRILPDPNRATSPTFIPPISSLPAPPLHRPYSPSPLLNPPSFNSPKPLISPHMGNPSNSLPPQHIGIPNSNFGQNNTNNNNLMGFHSLLSSSGSSLNNPIPSPSPIMKPSLPMKEKEPKPDNPQLILHNSLSPSQSPSPSPPLITTNYSNPYPGRFVLLEQPNVRQRKSYRNENRYILPNPITVCLREDSSNGGQLGIVVIEKSSKIQEGYVTVKLVNEDGKDLPSTKQSTLESTDGRLTVPLDNGNAAHFSLKVLETSEGTMFRFLFIVNYTSENTPFEERILSRPFQVFSNRKKNLRERPVVYDLKPAEGATDAETEVWIKGKGFSDRVLVSFGEKNAKIVETSDNLLTVIAPIFSTKLNRETVEVVVSNRYPHEQIPADKRLSFTYYRVDDNNNNNNNNILSNNNNRK